MANWLTDMLGITNSAQDKAMDAYREQMGQAAGVQLDAIERAKQYLQTYYLGGAGLTGGGGGIGGAGGLNMAGLTPDQLAKAMAAAMTASGGTSQGGLIVVPGGMNPGGFGYMGSTPYVYSHTGRLGEGYGIPLNGAGGGSFDQQKFLDALKQMGIDPTATAPQAPAAKWGDAGYVSSGGAMGELMEAYNRAMAQMQAGKSEAMTNLQADSAKAMGYIPEYLQKGREVAESYYMPYRRAMDVLSGVAQGTPEETQRLVQGSPLYQWQQQQAQQSLDRAMRAKGLGSSRFGMKAQADLTAELAAKEQQRRLEQMMQMYQASGQLGMGMGQAYTGAGGKLADMGMGYAKDRLGLTTGMATQMAGLDDTTGAKRSGLLQDLGTSMAGAEGALGSAQANAYAASAANMLANSGNKGGSFLDNALKIYTAGTTGGWW